MMPLQNCLPKTSLLIIALLSITTAKSGGLYLYEVATDDLGLASAGAAARADDASVMVNNPAGLSHVNDRSFSIGFQGLSADAEFKLNNDSLDSPGNVVNFTPVLSAFYSHQIDNNWTFGLGVYGNFGLVLDYGNWQAGSLLEEVGIQALTIQPSMSYRFNNNWSVGLATTLNYGMFSLDNGLLEDKINETDWSYGFKAGVLYEYSDNTRFGLGFSTETDYDYSIQLGLFNNDLDAVFNAPRQLMFSAYHQVNSDWAVMGNLGWQDWSEYSQDSRYDDTYHVAVGAQYFYSPELTWNMGVAYDTSMLKSQDQGEITLPTGQTWRLGIGARYQVTKDSSIGAAFETAFIDSSDVSFVGLKGKYDEPRLYFFMLNYSWSL